MFVTILTNKYMSTISLPEKVNGRYWLNCKIDDKDTNLAAIEGVNEEWELKSNNRFWLIDSKKRKIKNVKLKPLSVYYLTNKNNNKLIVFTEPHTNDRQVFTKYIFKDSIRLTIGRSNNNDISFANNSVSAKHAVLSCKSGKWSVEDCNSTNGTFVNNERIKVKDLKIGDVVYIMGLKIIVSKNLIALNNPDGQVNISNKLSSYIPQVIQPRDEDDLEIKEPEYFYRSPRFKRDIKTAKFKIDSPPTSPIANEMPMALVLGTSFAMGMMSVVTLISAIMTGNFISMAMGGSMLIGTVFLPIVTKAYEKKSKLKKEQKRQKRYREYLENMASKIMEKCQSQKEILEDNIVSIDECENRILQQKRNLWERSINQNDFLRIRVGTGNILLDADIQYGGKKFDIDDDNLQEELYVLAEKPKVLEDVPISYSMHDDFVSGVIGSDYKLTEFAKGIIIQLASFYSYDEVNFVFLYDQDSEKEFSFVRWLPHVWNKDKTFRFVATNNNEVKEISTYLEKEIEQRLSLSENKIEDAKPYYIVFSMSKSLAVRANMLKNIYSAKDNLNISVIAFYNELKDLPKECTMVAQLQDNEGRLFDKNDISGKFVEFNPDIFPKHSTRELSLCLANTILNTSDGANQLPNMVTFLNLFDVGKVEHLNSLSRWQENDPTRSLECPVGVDTLGGKFMLDLHERYHGPHGLVAGMTGSGKSEFIISYILSLAINYHPDEVAFILIDYKGGGMAKSFEKLPHTVGIITNLDGAAIKRSLVSIESELKRRQSIFAEVSKKVQVSNIDIYKYQRLYRDGVVNEPLQHLFIISDEFAELKTQQPEFMTQLVSAARIGRSLGVHLILATQKPSGVVDDQIWSNSRFRICLKVQERADSMDMLKRDDAAKLSETGRFYLQVGYNELFEIGQSAWSGAPYYPSDTVIIDKDISVDVININGESVKAAKLDKRPTNSKETIKQVDAITDYLCNVAYEENIKVKPLWLEPIPALIYVDDLYKKHKVSTEKFTLNPVVGEYDDPARQRQCELTLPISSDGNAIVYGSAGSGKTTFLNAIVYSLISHHAPDEVNLYLLDFASETMGMFKSSPHVGDVMFSYEDEIIHNLFKMLERELYKRKKLFSNYGGDYKSFINSSETKLSSIVIMISNYTAFSEIYEQEEENVAYLSREGTKYGVYFVISSASPSGVRFRLLQNFNQIITLQLNDDSEYASIVGKTDGLLPSKIDGRGLIKLDNLYEFQTAQISKNKSAHDFMKSYNKDITKKYKNKAQPVPVLPSKVDVAYLSNYLENNINFNIPIGIDCNTINVYKYNFSTRYINFVLSQSDESEDFACQFISLIENQYINNLYGLNLPQSLISVTDNKNLCKDISTTEKAIDELFDLSVNRNNVYKESDNPSKQADSFTPIIILINSFSTCLNSLSDEKKEKLKLMLDKTEINYKMYFILCDKTTSVSNYTYEPWYKNNVSNNNGLWLGNGVSEQYYLKANRSSSEMRQNLPVGFGYVFKNGNAIKAKMLCGLEGCDNDGE